MHGLIFETSIWLLAGSTRLDLPSTQKQQEPKSPSSSALASKVHRKLRWMELSEANHTVPIFEIIRHYRSNRTQNSTLNERSMFLATAKCTAKAAWKYSGTDFFTMCSNTTPNHLEQAQRLANNTQTACLPPSIWLCKQIQLMHNINKLKFGASICALTC